MLQIVRWSASNPAVIRIEPSNQESAIVTALSPGITSITAERRMPSGELSTGGLRDVQGISSSCVAVPELLLEVTP
jgi:hypothetical protein